MTRCIRLILLVVLNCTYWLPPLSAQVSFELKTSPEVDFIFTSIGDYKTGITRFNSLKLNVSSDRRWDLSVKSTTSDWSVVEAYSSGGVIPALDILELRVRNSSSTPLISDFFSITDNDQYLIGSAVTDIDVPCPNSGTNTAGNYLTLPSCYEFFVDFRITPGLDPVNYVRPGLYRMEIVFTISEDL
ncbi:hypothetical protein [Saccharicrinis sp. FJH54]|uniref:hypothetical protein n=1 Tax=Saccharicrinis sp. FJH54 TaxID=3344665 RepID=UPI0035D4DC05